MAIAGTATVKNLAKFRAMYDGKLIRYSYGVSLQGVVGIVVTVETGGDHYPHYIEGHRLHPDRDYLVFDLRDKDGGVQNYWLTPDRIEVWEGEHAS